jgi:hypothetical protein
VASGVWKVALLLGLLHLRLLEWPLVVWMV